MTPPIGPPIWWAWNWAFNRACRSSFRWARATYSGFLHGGVILPFISLIARVASSGEEKATKPKPLLLPLSSFMTLHDVMLPSSWKIVRSSSSPMASSRFFTYRLHPLNFSDLVCSLSFLSSASRSDLRCALLTTQDLPSWVNPLSSSTADLADSGASKFTNPNSFDFPSESRIITTLVISPCLPKISFRSSSVQFSEMFLT
mmetsp:Transcript_2134/g.6318  ORF Transcript_2134/g.6318 Transcript_2134/m.6318 type:complete len:202 (+) Transcript_2134:982-1587(+)